MNNVGSNIKLLRKTAHLTQQQLSVYLDIDQTHLSKIEANLRPVNADIIDKINKLFCVTFEQLQSNKININEIHLSLNNSEIDVNDLRAIADINTIAYNSKLMGEFLSMKN